MIDGTRVTGGVSVADDPTGVSASEPLEPEARPKPGSLWAGVLVGGAVDVGGSTVFATIVIAVWAFLNAPPSSSRDEFMELATEQLVSLDTAWGLVMAVVGCGFSVLGGYVCAVLAKERWRTAVAIYAGGLALFGFVSNLGYYSVGTSLALILVSILSAWAGGWLREGRRRGLRPAA